MDTFKETLWATKGRLNRMFKYFRNKPIYIKYEYNNSMGVHKIREGNRVYDSFEIIGSEGKWPTLVNVILKKKATIVWEQEFEGPQVWWFTGLGKLEMINSGPRCYFSIKHND